MKKQLAVLLGVLIPCAVGAADFNATWTCDMTYSKRWLIGGMVSATRKPEIRAGLSYSTTGVLLSADVLRSNPRGNFYAGLGGVMSDEPSTWRTHQKPPRGGTQVEFIQERADETHWGGYAVFGMRSTAPTGPNATMELRLMGFDHGGRAAISWGVIF